MVAKFFGWLGSHSEKRPGWVILITVIVTALAIAGVARLRQEYGYETMLPKKIESVKTMKEVNKIFGGMEEEQILIEGKNVIDAKVLKKVFAYPEYLKTRGEIWKSFATDVITPLDDMVYVPSVSLSMTSVSAGTPQAALILSSLPQAGASIPLSDKFPYLSDAEIVKQVKKNLEIAREQAKKMGMPIGQQNISEDGKALLLTVKVNPKLNFNEMIKKVKKFESETKDYFKDIPGFRTYIYGQASMQSDSSKKTTKDTRLLFAIAFIFILVVLFLTFRRISDVLLTIAVILITIIWVMGLSGWLGFPFTYTGTAIMPLMLGIDIAYAIHVLSRYYEERRKGNDPFKSALTSVKTVGVAVFLTAATTAFGFASFGISNMPPIQQFGGLCFAGVMFSFILAVTFLPAALVLRDRRKKSREKWDERHEKAGREAGKSFVDKVLVRVAILSEHHRAIVFTITAIILIACGLSITQIKTEADLEKMMPKDMPSVIAMEKIGKYFEGQEAVAYTLVEAKEGMQILSPQALKAMIEFENALARGHERGEKGELLFDRSRMMSLADIVSKQAGGIPDSPAEIMRILMSMSTGKKGEQNNRLMNPEYPNATMITMRIGRGTQNDMKKMAEIMAARAKEVEKEHPGLDFKNSGVPVLMNDLLGSITPTQLKTTGVALVLCAGIVTLTFGSLFAGLAATSVVFLGIALEIGMLALLGWPLDFMTVMISALVIGAGIDFGIHVTHRFREEWHEGGLDVDEAMRRTIGNVGKALLAAAVTTAGAFGIIAISGMSFIRRFGAVTAFSLIFALLAALLFLPSVLAVHANAVEKRKGKAA